MVLSSVGAHAPCVFVCGGRGDWGGGPNHEQNEGEMESEMETVSHPEMFLNK